MQFICVVALVTAAAAAIADHRTGEISNWITLPPAIGAPLLYGAFFGPEQAIRSVSSLLLCGSVPCLLFYRGAMGGGDVKLLAALGAITGGDLLTGLEIQLVSLLIAALLALAVLSWRGTLLSTILRASRSALRHLLGRSAPCEHSETPFTSLRLGAPVFLGTVVVVLPSLLRDVVSW
ncbi:MAG: A24 family peptidase [Myxococcota bacterium]